MAASRNLRLRVGVIGLGRLWEARHKPALIRLASQFRVVAVYDQVARRAEIEAASLRCSASRSVSSLIERSDVDLVYLLTPQWFGLHPARLAADAGKPIYSALPVAGDTAGLIELASILRSRGVPFIPELARRFYPATLRLRELLATRLGAPRLILGLNRLHGFDRYGSPGPASQLTPAPLAIDPGSYLLDWCRSIFGSDPTSIQGFGGSVIPVIEGNLGPDFESISAEFAEGALAQIALGRYHREPWGEAARYLPRPGFQVFAERGVAWLEMPDKIQWTDSEGAHEERLPSEPTVGEVLNDHVHRLIRGDQSLAPTIDDALRIAGLVADLQRSRREGRAIAVNRPEDAQPD